MIEFIHREIFRISIYNNIIICVEKQAKVELRT